jgi:hypothetical protein
MKRQIARLDVFVDTESNSPSGTAQVENGRFVLNMNLGDSKTIPIDTKEAFQAVFAHELGHFVAMIMRDPTHDPSNKLFQMITNDSSAVLPAERKAWEIAKEIVPDLDRTTEAKCLKSYEDNSSWSDSCEPIPSGLPGVCPEDDEAKDRLRAMYWKAEEAKQAHKAHVWEWSILAVIFGLYWIAGLLNMGIR